MYTCDLNETVVAFNVYIQQVRVMQITSIANETRSGGRKGRLFDVIIGQIGWKKSEWGGKFRLNNDAHLIYPDCVVDGDSSGGVGDSDGNGDEVETASWVRSSRE